MKIRILQDISHFRFLHFPRLFRKSSESVDFMYSQEIPTFPKISSARNSTFTPDIGNKLIVESWVGVHIRNRQLFNISIQKLSTPKYRPAGGGIWFFPPLIQKIAQAGWPEKWVGTDIRKRDCSKRFAMSGCLCGWILFWPIHYTSHICIFLNFIVIYSIDLMAILLFLLLSHRLKGH